MFFSFSLSCFFFFARKLFLRIRQQTCVLTGLTVDSNGSRKPICKHLSCLLTCISCAVSSTFDLLMYHVLRFFHIKGTLVGSPNQLWVLEHSFKALSAFFPGDKLMSSGWNNVQIDLFWYKCPHGDHGDVTPPFYCIPYFSRFMYMKNREKRLSCIVAVADAI